MEPALQGRLKSFKLTDVLTFLNLSRKTGRLNLSSRSRRVQIYFDSGSIVFAASDQQKHRLSALLLKKKRIDPGEARRIEEVMLEDGEKFGQIAVAQNVLAEEEVRDFLKIQVSEILYDSFLWNEGSFTFADDAQMPEYAVTIAVDLSNLIMEGARRIDEWDRCRELLPDPEAVFRVVASPEIQEKITLSLNEWKILFLMDGRSTLREICERSDEEDLEAYRVVYGLLANKLIEHAPPPEEEPDEGADLADAVLRLQNEAQHPIPVSEMTTGVMPDDTGLLISPDANLTYRDVMRVTMARLTLKSTEVQHVFPLVDHEYLVGRTASSQVCLPDPSVSSVHARIFRSPDGYMIEDLNSRNGTYINEERIQKAVLKENDLIRMGGSELVYNIVCDRDPRRT